jgi:hypothetical protein
MHVLLRCARSDVARGHLRLILNTFVRNNDMMCPFGPSISVQLISKYPHIAAAGVS